jgi:GTP-binding protein
LRVDSARFVAGAATRKGLPPESLPEVAFAGKSNVGKSSLLNRFVGRHGLARVSKTPGRTQQLNFFSINEAVLFVDLPGYGFANVPLAVRDRWRTLVESYLASRHALCGVVVIVDVRRGVQEEDEQLLEFLAAKGVSAVLVVTKVDKLARGERLQQLRRIGKQRPAIPLVAFSAATGEGVADLWRVVEALTGETSVRRPRRAQRATPESEGHG